MLRFLYEQHIDFLLVGHTSNLYILNSCSLSVVVSTKACNKYELVDNKIYCEAGVGVIRLANDMIDKGISGFEYLTGLPGTVGAAICNNSSCKTNSISQLLVSAEVLLPNGDVVNLSSDDFQFHFRTSIIKEKRLRGIILSAILMAKPSSNQELRILSDINANERRLYLEGHSKNLGCTVNRCFINGKMPLRYFIPYIIYLKWLSLTKKDQALINLFAKKFLCRLAGCKLIVPYVSSKNPIIFMWLDEGADIAFPYYLDFMRKVYRTDKLEIEIIK